MMDATTDISQLQLGGNGPAVAEARADAQTAGLPAPWLLYRRREGSAETTFSMWTASRGFKAPVFNHRALVLGLRSTLKTADLDELRAEAYRQEWLITVYLVGMACSRTLVRADRR